MYHSVTFLDKDADDINTGGFYFDSIDPEIGIQPETKYKRNGSVVSTMVAPYYYSYNGTNTWTDWHLIPSSRPDIAMPSIPSEKYIEIPGRDGSYDLTEYLSGKPTYGDRQGSLEFYHQNGYENFETIRKEMAYCLHGKKLKMILEDDPAYYYEGRFKLNGWKSEAGHSKVTIDYRLGPYKWDVHEQGLDSTVWDNFAFERDYDYWYPYQGNTIDPPVKVRGYSTLIIKADLKSGGSITVNGYESVVSGGATVINFQVFAPTSGTKKNVFEITADKYNSITFRGGQL